MNGWTDQDYLLLKGLAVFGVLFALWACWVLRRL